MMHSSTLAGSSLARLTASLTTSAPSLVAGNSDKLPWNFPIGVRTPEMITTSVSLYEGISSSLLR